MGRRMTNTTKSGKYMNPTDQARKEARKKELKKNKKQRQLVRQTVLKNKDPKHLIREMEKIDEMEYDVYNPPQLGEKVLKDKRRKLKETLDRLMKMYEKDNPELYDSINREMQEYNGKRLEKVKFFESVKHAQEVNIADIPLPSGDALPSQMDVDIPLPDDDPGSSSLAKAHAAAAAISARMSTAQIPLPSMAAHGPAFMPPAAAALLSQRPSHGILKRQGHLQDDKTMDAMAHEKKNPPGPPPGSPTPLSSDSEDSGSDSDDEGGSTRRKKRIRFTDEMDKQDKDTRGKFKSSSPKKVSDLQMMMLEMAGQDGPEFRTASESESEEEEEGGAEDDTADKPGLIPPPPPAGLPPPHIIAAQRAAAMAGHMRPQLPTGLPPGRPPGMPPGPPPGLPPHLMRPPGLPPRMPPGPPPMRPPSVHPSGADFQPNVVSAAPRLISRAQRVPTQTDKDTSVIQAKPRLRNTAAEVTRFVPTTLRVKRGDEKRKTGAAPARYTHITPGDNRQQQPQQTKDDVYEDFLREVQGLM